jgi:photosystem II stability/assembly factor-like uncharacterized protein
MGYWGKISMIKHMTISAVVVIALATSLASCKKKESGFKPPWIPSIYGNNISKVFAFDKDDILLIGSFGFAARTSKGSEIKFENSKKDFWEFQNTGLNEELLCDASFPDPMHGWAVGISGLIIHTADGGKTWVKQNSGTDKHLFTVYFPDCKNGWAAGNLNTIIHTADGGNTWAQQKEGESSEKDFFAVDVSFNGLYFFDANEGWLVGEFGTVYHTTDAGEHWNYVPTPELAPLKLTEQDWEQPRPSLYDVRFADRNRGFILGIDGIMIKTEDGGKSWRKVDSKATRALYSIAIVGDKCWAVGDRGNYVVSTDGGNTWTAKPKAIHAKGWLTSVAFVDENTGWVVGKSGAVFKTVDGGETWDWLSGVSYDWPEFKPPKFLVGE